MGGGRKCGQNQKLLDQRAIITHILTPNLVAQTIVVSEIKGSIRTDGQKDGHGYIESAADAEIANI